MRAGVQGRGSKLDRVGSLLRGTGRGAILNLEFFGGAAVSGANCDSGMAAVVEAEDGEKEPVGHDGDEGRDDHRADQEGEKTRREGGALEGLPEIAVEQPVPGQPRRAPAVVVQEPAAQAISERIDGGESPGITRELSQRGVDLV